MAFDNELSATSRPVPVSMGPHSLTLGKGIVMRKLVLAAVLVLVAGGAQASSYLQIGGTVVDPILTMTGAVHPYSGTNLQPDANLSGAILPGADLTGANLSNANLSNADLYYANLWDANLGSANLSDANLSYANLTNANLWDANLSNADLWDANLSYANLIGASLTGAYLTGANLSNADLWDANLSNADLSNAYGLSNTTGTPDYDALTNFTGTGFDPVAAGWNLVPEPSTALLVGLGLVGMAARKETRSPVQQ